MWRAERHAADLAHRDRKPIEAALDQRAIDDEIAVALFDELADDRALVGRDAMRSPGAMRASDRASAAESGTTVTFPAGRSDASSARAMP
jgi:hypothetical protein